MSFYYDKVCNRILTGKSGPHGKSHKMNGLYDLIQNGIAIPLGHAYFKFGRRDPDAVQKVIKKLEEITQRKITKEEKEFIEKV